MPLIKPVSDLRNYPDVLKGVKVGQPVYLTKNGEGRYVIIDIEDYSIFEEATRLGTELMRGRISGEREGWMSSQAMREHFKERANV
ncbi:MAG: type II toxin-antitoxin system prevent-host-death family antitoxin [Kiritimatiellae bacterium]|nr:type II toxin-antitoxin system prevent-host-death family antitoxin [Kiritimatiellia bacterium]